MKIIESNNLSLHITGEPIEGDVKNNLCLKAWTLLKADYPHLPPVAIHLHKNIPMGAGLGGGSSDGASTLRLLNIFFSLAISDEKLAGYALQLGSDCPFFIYNRPCIAQGRGEIIEPIDIDLSEYKILLVHPGIHVSTAWAFTQLKPQKPEIDFISLLKAPVSDWRYELKNDFERALFTAHPVLEEIKNQLYSQGALYASMTGSGSCIYGIFPKHLPSSISFDAKYRVITLNTTA